MAWQTVIGLEVHAQLKTQSKLFSAAATTFGAPPNSQTSFIDAGLPGVLPVLNQKAVEMAIQFGIAIQAQINRTSYFERKNYFYPDLPKGYQISQYQEPIVTNGYLDIIGDEGNHKSIHIVRAHLEEDAGKSMHEAHPAFTGIDLNRAGTPLLEIVTSPCLHSAAETVAYLKQLHQLVRFLGICDGNMQEGSFRCDVNISLRPLGSNVLGTRTELKNLNSFRFIEKAIRYEELRHQEYLESGQTIIQETRLYSPEKDATYPMRNKENENDYRYFPDPDLLPIYITEQQINLIRADLPALPWEIRQCLETEYQLNEEDIHFLLSAPAIFHFFEKVKSNTAASAKLIVNWLRGPLLSVLNENNLAFENAPISPKELALLLDKIHDSTLTNQNARIVFSKLIEGNKDIEALIISLKNQSLTDTQAIEDMIKKIIAEHPQQAADYKSGKDKLLGFFVGQVLKQTQGKADPGMINQLVKKYLMT